MSNSEQTIADGRDSCMQDATEMQLGGRRIDPNTVRDGYWIDGLTDRWAGGGRVAGVCRMSE